MFLKIHTFKHNFNYRLTIALKVIAKAPKVSSHPHVVKKLWHQTIKFRLVNVMLSLLFWYGLQLALNEIYGLWLMFVVAGDYPRVLIMPNWLVNYIVTYKDEKISAKIIPFVANLSC